MITLLMWVVGLPALWLLIAPDQLTWTGVALLGLAPLLVYGIARWIGRTPSRSLVDVLRDIEGEPVVDAPGAAPRGRAGAPPGLRPRTNGGEPL